MRVYTAEWPMRVATGVRGARLLLAVRALVFMCGLLACEASPFGSGLVDLISGKHGPDQKCTGDQEHLGLEHYITVNVFEAIAEAAEHGSCCWRWACILCEAGKYGVSGQCYDCPTFTSELVTPRTPGPRWCQNDCGELYKDSQRNTQKILSNAVVFKDISSQMDASGAVLHWEESAALTRPQTPSSSFQGFLGTAFTSQTSLVFEAVPKQPVCRTCARDKAPLQAPPAFILRHFREQLPGMGLSEQEIKSLEEQNEKSLLEDFSWRICVRCPNGMIVHKGFEASDDVLALTQQEFPAQGALPASLQLPCKTCSVGAGITTDGIACVKCAKGQYQSIAIVPLPESGLQLVVGAACASCRLGYQLQTLNLLDTSEAVTLFGQCRSRTELGCCAPCPQNFFRGNANTEKCSAVALAQAGVVQGKMTALGAVSERACAAGEELLFCTEGGCERDQRLAGQKAWRTCVPCVWNETTRSKPDAAGCVPCAGLEHLRSPEDPRACRSCSACEEVLETETVFDLALETALFVLEPGQFRARKVAATCSALSRRQITSAAGALSATGEDHWRPADRRRGQAIERLHAVDRADRCLMKHCAAFCAGFMYSDGCGPQTPREGVWVRSPAREEVRLQALAPGADVAGWTVLTEGVCRTCTFCAAGFYNDECNSPTAYELGRPQGACRPCRTQCPAGSFLLHPERDAGCHDPPVHQQATDGSGNWMISRDYACERCPTWVKLGASLRAVTVCGLQAQYSYFDTAGATFDASDQLQARTHTVSFSAADEALIPQAGSNRAPRKNFGTFLQHAKPYCPVGFFFDATRAGCAFVEQTDAAKVLQLPGLGQEVLVGYDSYDPTCCQVCQQCVAPLKSKDMVNWKECKGDSMQDVQNFCMDKCVLGYWKQAISANETQCRQCSTCHDGIL